MIETHDGSVYLARVLQTDADADLALLRIETDGAHWFAVPIESGERIPVGTKVFAIGHPIGLGWTVTQGIVSAHRRAGEVAPVQLIQTDAATSPGNSGGPLLNEQGHLVGIISAKLVSLSIENVTFAIPTSVVRSFLERGFNGRVDTIPGSTQHDHR
ncbi:MAG: trypsin-like peptidase domain-containing protein [Planctomycetes bacterium]|nr:trypsin-like peptidase domain-containing protein [Planctomycetota bacterium]